MRQLPRGSHCGGQLACRRRLVLRATPLSHPAAEHPRDRGGGGCHAVLALGAKESAFGLPLLIAAIAWARNDLALVRRREAYVVAIVVTTLVLFNWRISVPNDVPRAHDPGLLARVYATARYEVRATFGAFAPFFWSPERAHPDLASPVWLAPLAGLVAFMVWLRRSARRRPFAVALAFALVAPIASSPLALPANELADRYLFLGVLGGGIAFGTLVDRALDGSLLMVRRAGTGLATAVLLGETAVAMQASLAYRLDTKLW